jgi:hypothetical protein
MPEPMPTLPAATEASKPVEGVRGGSGEPSDPHAAAPLEEGASDTAAAPVSDAAAARPDRGERSDSGDAAARPAKRDDDRAASKSSGARPSEHRTSASESRLADAKSADAKPARRTGAKDGKRKPNGVLSVQSMPWSWVTVATQTKETPARFSLPPGVHIVQFHNDENGITKYESVLIESEQVYKLNEDMERGPVDDEREPPARLTAPATRRPQPGAR